MMLLLYYYATSIKSTWSKRNLRAAAKSWISAPLCLRSLCILLERQKKKPTTPNILTFSRSLNSSSSLVPSAPPTFSLTICRQTECIIVRAEAYTDHWTNPSYHTTNIQQTKGEKDDDDEDDDEDDVLSVSKQLKNWNSWNKQIRETPMLSNFSIN